MQPHFYMLFLTVQSAANLGLVHGLSVLGSRGVKQTDLRVRQKNPDQHKGAGSVRRTHSNLAGMSF